MKKRKIIAMILGAALLLGACGSNESAVTQLVNLQIEAEAGQSFGAGQSSEAAQSQAAEPETAESGPEIPEASRAADSDVDVDLTTMSSTMVYSNVYDMLMYPERYVGKTIRVSGEYYASYWEETGIYYHYIVIADAGACCEQGLEFIWDEGARSYPEDYPEDYTPVEIVGTFGVYEEGGYEYCYLATDGITIQ